MIGKEVSHKRGQAAMTVVVLFLAGSLIVMGGISFPIIKEIQGATEFLHSKHSYYLSEAALEDVAYRISVAKSYDTIEVLVLNGNIATATVTNTANGKDIVSKGSSANRIRKVQMSVVEGAGAAFFYGMQSGKGGIILENSSTVKGNLYSNGTIVGSGSNVIAGDVVSATSTGLVDGIKATGTVFAHTIQNSEIDKDAYYMVIDVPTVVWGTKYPESPDQATSSLPITDAQIDEWKADALAGGLIASTDSECTSGTYTIDTDMPLGPVKIECDLIIDKSSTDLTLAGAVWVEGTIRTKSGPKIYVDPSLSGKSIPFIADKPGDRTTSSKIIIINSAEFFGAGDNSFILMISQNNSAENGGTEIAIEGGNNAGGDLLVYAAHGEIRIKQSLTLKEVTAYRIRLQNSAEVIYESGLASLLFTSGPGGGFEVESWGEIE